MIFVPSRLIVTYIILSILMVLGLGIFAFLVFFPESPQSTLQQKITAEWFLFAALVATVLLAALLLRIISVRIGVKKELARIQSMGNYISLSSQLKSPKLHELSRPLAELFQQVSRINARQSLKMNSQHSLLSFLVANFDASLTITDMFGRILYASYLFEKQHQIPREKLIGRNIEQLIPNLYMQTIIHTISEPVRVEKEKKEDSTFTVYPFFNHEQELAYLLFDFRSESSYSYPLGSGGKTSNKKAESPTETKPLRQYIDGFFQRFLSRGDKKERGAQ